MKKVLQISNYLYPHIGGIEQTARNIIHALSDVSEYEQKVICFNEDAADGDYTCRRNETVHDFVDGVEVIRCACITKKASQSISIFFPAELKKVMDDFVPDIVIFHYPNPYQAEFFQNFLDRSFKLILYWHLDITKQKVLGRFFHPQNIRLLERADRIVATSPNYIDGSSYLSRYREKCVVIPNCINEERLKVTNGIKARAKEIRKGNDGKIICFGVGRHVPYKGFAYLIRASKMLDDRFRIFIGGEGELTGMLKREAENDSKIIFLGKINDEELAAWYLAMDIFCFPSIMKNEAFGIALAEAMYFGKPAVTFTIPGSGVNYVCVNGVTGIEVPNRDTDAYANALKRLSADEGLMADMGSKGKEYAEKNFLFPQFKDRIIAITEN